MAFARGGSHGLAAEEVEVNAIAAPHPDRNIDDRNTTTSIYFRNPDDNYLKVTNWAGPDPDRWE